MQDALMDGTPMIVFAGQVATTAIGTDAFQEADVMGIARFALRPAFEQVDTVGAEQSTHQHVRARTLPSEECTLGPHNLHFMTVYRSCKTR